MANYLFQIGFCFVLLLVFVIPYSLWESRRRQRKIEAAFAGRDELTATTFYERYFQSEGIPKNIVDRIKQILEEELGADLSRLTSNDDFTKNLKFFWDYDSLTDVEIIMRFEEEFDIKITNEEVSQVRTISDMVKLVWLKTRQRDV